MIHVTATLRVPYHVIADCMLTLKVIIYGRFLVFFIRLSNQRIVMKMRFKFDELIYVLIQILQMYIFFYPREL